MNAAVASDLLLQIKNLRVEFAARTVLSNITFDVLAGETVGLVGESGSGKSTLARAILRLVRASNGSIMWRGQELLSCTSNTLRRLRRDLQIVFQDPLASLNPRMTIGQSIAEPLSIFAPDLNNAERRLRVGDMLRRVGLTADLIDRYPHEFSGGQCQRVGIARAMILSPRLLICDEPVSSLDVSIQGQIVNLLVDLQREAGMAMLFISHNLAVVRHLSHRILVMYAGRLVEVAACDALFASPMHPYTQALLTAVPSIDLKSGPGLVLPEPQAMPLPVTTGCAFRERCIHAMTVCATIAPPLEEVTAGHWVACHVASKLVS